MTGGLGRLARSPEEMGINMAAATARALVHYAPYAPEPGDVFITSWAKSGTTLMQQMFHQIRMVAAGRRRYGFRRHQPHDPLG